ncbi:hypothetical protein NP493_96g00004 [Ridgeia piscesae]|uniref:Uncharacterized protein n=1 Tax=Ridgeia piscesae TaxID=27915 RepID=A0AAD9P7X3_RIDPI|nr:hypothetical protein NP493_96g00004 [Ridgeia piscesae]
MLGVPMRSHIAMVSITKPPQDLDLPDNMSVPNNYCRSPTSRAMARSNPSSPIDSPSGRRMPPRPRSAASSPGSWEESFLELSRGLELICGSPKQERRHQHATADSPRRQIRRGQSVPVIPRVGRSLSTGKVPDDGTTARLYCPVRVKHEESEDKLSEKLASICKADRSPSPSPCPTSDPSPRLFPVQPEPEPDMTLTRTSRAFRACVDIGPNTIDDVSVSVEDGMLRVRGLDNCCTLIAQRDLPPGVDVGRLVCRIDDGSLDVSEHPSVFMKSTLPLGSPAYRYCPLICEHGGDDGDQFKLVLHFPGEYHLHDLCVKTVDEQLIVSARPQRRDQEHSRHALVFAARCQLVIQLPAFVDTRTVTALLTTRNQLIVLSSTSTLSRCNTL